MAQKKRKEEPGYWQHIPGYNWLLGYVESKAMYDCQKYRWDKKNKLNQKKDEGHI